MSTEKGPEAKQPPTPMAHTSFRGCLIWLAGYGYKPGRTVFASISTILSFAIIYYVLGHVVGNQPSMSPLYAFIISINSFHGRGFFPTGFLSMLPMAVCAAFEAIISLTIEMSYIAAFTHRYFGK
jgi:hypothetical protein